ncbi:geranylgeranyl transferase type-2 subunit alpha-like [Melanerpes formicivorus]|uniref:geranylgeranyl transferase type-2 subunit alpha-like n=2 Tax=Melanerpes formicivorus TaxID=211600 RepID=UPI00358F7249
MAERSQAAPLLSEHKEQREPYGPRRPPPAAPPVTAGAPQHGRLKLQAPDAARRRQRQEKLRLYREGMQALREKLAAGRLDEEVLELTGSLLEANPEVGTCWNLRRLALPPEPNWLERELAFVGRCLTKSPKSYGAWHHRSWVLSHAPGPRPNPAHRQLCDWLLASDPRNWGGGRLPAQPWSTPGLRPGSCWNQPWETPPGCANRFRPVASPRPLQSTPGSTAGCWPRTCSRSCCTPGSCWARTSPTSPPGTTAGGCWRRAAPSCWAPIGCSRSSAWCTTLSSPTPRTRAPGSTSAASSPGAPPPPRLLCLYAARGRVALGFSRPIRAGDKLQVSLEGSPLEGVWLSGAGRGRPAHTWILEFPPSLAPPTAHFRVTWEGDSAPKEVTLEPEASEAWWQEPIRAEELLWPEVGVAPREVLQQQAEVCQQLRELEPGSRGCLLTLVLLLWALDPLGNEEEIRECLRELREADPLRRGFLLDLEARVEMGVALLRAGPGEELDLEGKALTSLPLLHHLTLVPALRLGRNRLAAVPGGPLPRLQELDLSHNCISTLQGAPALPALRWISLEGNPIGHASALAPLAACPHLAELRLAETPLAATPDAASQLAELLPGIRILLS